MASTDTHTDTHSARESWFRAAIEIFRPRFTEVGYPLPENVRVSVGFGPTGARQENGTIVGVTLSRRCSADGVNEIWISPEEKDTAEMLFTLLHELVHATLDNEDGHRGRFAEIGTRLGFEGKMTEGNPNIELAAELIVIEKELGTYPGAQVNLAGIFAPAGAAAPLPVLVGSGPVSSAGGPQTNRQMKVVCPEGDCSFHLNGKPYSFRLSRAMFAVGAPRCPAGHEMVMD